MAAGAVVITDYLAVFWDGLDDGGLEIAHGGRSRCCSWRCRTCAASRPIGLGVVLRLALWSIFVLVVVTVIAFVSSSTRAVITDSIELGSMPPWEDAIFAVGVASVAVIGVEAASGLAGEVRSADARPGSGWCLPARAWRCCCSGGVGRGADGAARGGRRDPLGGRFEEAPVLGIVNAYEQAWLVDAAATW